MLTHPWFPDRVNNKIIIHGHTQHEINVTAEKSLYTYQIDAINSKIQNDFSTDHDEVSWQESLGNIQVLETWLQQVQAKI